VSGDEELNQKLFLKINGSDRTRVSMPGWGKMNTEKRQKGVTLRLLWQEYKEQHPNGYQYSQFCEH
jgi:transposase